MRQRMPEDYMRYEPLLTRSPAEVLEPTRAPRAPRRVRRIQREPGPVSGMLRFFNGLL